ncbi:MAG: enoyl-CoA hydratase-related protein [Candidatus Marinimicrobia bacterium]|nr:enoyl-CoA hydratase-related protein [Candidatus Neomarinimicrobiota bacterium]
MTPLPEKDNLILELADSWVTIWFNRPDNRNALSVGMVNDLKDTLESVRDDRSVRGVTFRGKGGVFCAGADLKGLKALFEEDAEKEELVKFSVEISHLFDLINTMPQVTVMVIEGAAMAGGFGLACSGDVIIVQKDTKFALTETMIGLSPAQISPLVIHRLGSALGRRLMLTGARLNGEEAAQIGLADFVGADEFEMAELEQKIKTQVLRCAPGAVGITKNFIKEIPHLTKEEMIELAANSFAECILSDEGREGITSFVEKRKPKWAK